MQSVVQSFEQTVQKYCIISHDSTNIFDEKYVHHESVYTQNVSFKDFNEIMPKVQGNDKQREVSL